MSSSRLSSVTAGLLGLLGLWFIWFGTRYYDAPVSGEGLGLIWLPILGFFLVFGLILFGVAAYGYQRNRPDITTGLLVGVLVLIGTFYFDMHHWSPNTQLVITVGFLVSAIPAIVAGIVVRRVTLRPGPT